MTNSTGLTTKIGPVYVNIYVNFRGFGAMVLDNTNQGV